MTLLETITKAAAGGADAPTSAVSNFPVLLNGDEAFRKLTPEGGDSPSDSLVKRLVGWKIPESDVKSIETVEKLVKKLRRKLKNRKSLGREEFRGLLSSLPEKKLGDVVGGELVGLYAEGCVILGLWETLESMILSGLIGRLGPNDLVEKLVEKNRSDLLCLYANHVSEIRASELVLILEHFLSPPRGSRECMLKVRKEWESQAILAVEKATQKGLPDEVTSLARDASILLMMAHDGFSSSELCLHSLFSSPNLDGLIMSSAISRLGGSEVLSLVRYLKKWLEKYERFPEGCPCREAGPALGLKICELVPSLESVVRGMALVIDEHYPYLVLNSQFHGEMSSIRQVVDSLASAAGSCCSLANVIENLRSV